MAYYFTENRMGFPGITSITSVVTTTAINSTSIPIGTIVRGSDPTLGGGEFIYLAGVGSTIVGSVVAYNLSGQTTTLEPAATTYGGAAVAVAMAANTSTTGLAWYQIAGCATVSKTTIKFNPNVAVYISATSGKITSTLGTGLQIEGARSSNAATVASATATVLVTIDRPHMQGSKT